LRPAPVHRKSRILTWRHGVPPLHAISRSGWCRKVFAFASLWAGTVKSQYRCNCWRHMPIGRSTPFTRRGLRPIAPRINGSVECPEPGPGNCQSSWMNFPDSRAFNNWLPRATSAALDRDWLSAAIFPVKPAVLSRWRERTASERYLCKVTVVRLGHRSSRVGFLYSDSEILCADGQRR